MLIDILPDSRDVEGRASHHLALVALAHRERPYCASSGAASRGSVAATATAARSTVVKVATRARWDMGRSDREPRQQAIWPVPRGQPHDVFR